MQQRTGDAKMSGRWVIGLFPRPWRQRYADELAGVLQAHPPSFRDMIGLLYCALDAHLDPQVIDGGDFSFMQGRPTMRTQIMAAAAAAAGLALILGFVITDPGWITPKLAIFHGLGVVGLIGVHRRHADAAPVLAWFGIVPVAVAYLVGLALLLPAVNDLPLPAIGTRGFGFVAQEALWISSLLFGAVTLAIGVLPRLAAAAVTVGSPMAMVGMFNGPTPPLEMGALAVAGAYLYAIGLIWLGLSGWARSGASHPIRPATA
jgi:hypothetical protein